MMRQWKTLAIGSVFTGLMMTGCGNTNAPPPGTLPFPHRHQTTGTHPITISQPSISVEITHVSSSAAGPTWLWGLSAIWYRSNSPSVWRSVAPSANRIEGGWVVRQRGWFASKAEGNSFVLYHTTDGGKLWQNNDTFSGVPISMSWPTKATGFLLTTRGPNDSSGGTLSATLWQTTTGGQTWKPIPITFSVSGRGGYPTDVTFASPMSGWVTGSSLAMATAWLFHSSDGGHHWIPKNLPLPPHTDGFASLIMAEAIGNRIAIPALMATHHGDRLATLLYTWSPGNAWHYSSSIALSQNPILSPWDLLSAQNVWIATSTETIQPVLQPAANELTPARHGSTSSEEPIFLWHSVDGGTHWTSIQPVQTTGLQGLSLNMSSSLDGYLVLTKMGLSDVLYTRDGGHHWQQLFIRS